MAYKGLMLPYFEGAMKRFLYVLGPLVLLWVLVLWF
jgi:hypothetical protein